MMEAPKLSGRHVLVVEDEPMIAMLIEDMLADLGCVLVSTSHDLEGALTQARAAERVDAALLDVNLAGQSVFPVADILRAKSVPIVFCSGYGDSALRDIDRGAPVLQKPYTLADLARSLSVALGV